MVKPNLRTKSVGTKVNEEEYARLEGAAQQASKTLGEWSREVMLSSANGQSAHGDGGVRQVEALMAELVALRAILLNVLFKQSNGQRLTAEEMQSLIDRADSEKFKKARERLGRNQNKDKNIQ